MGQKYTYACMTAKNYDRFIMWLQQPENMLDLVTNACRKVFSQ